MNRTRIPDDYERTLAQKFYVDDFLASAPTPEAALSLIEVGISRFERYNLKLCKVQSNSDVIRKAYLSKDTGRSVTTGTGVQIFFSGG